jgi:ATP-dependent Clp protease ATP-binding subunit ClpA
MPKVNVYLADQLAEAVRKYNISLSAVCQRALESEVATKLPILSMTPRAREVLNLALREAESLGHKYIGTEHLLLALLSEKGGIAAQAARALDVDAQLRDKVLEMITNEGNMESNRVGDGKGNLLGHLVEGHEGKPVIVDEAGEPVQVIKDEKGEFIAVDHEGRPKPPRPIQGSPLTVTLDKMGNLMVVVDSEGREVGE